MVALARYVTDSSTFQRFVTLIIVGAGVLVGVETYPNVVTNHGPLLHVLDQLVLWIFVAEIAIKMVAEGRRPWRFFTDPWNVFDFVIVAGAFTPFAAGYATVLRLLRLLRVLRLLRALPKLQLLVGALLKSIPSMAYVSILLGLLFYVYAVAAVFLYGANDPVHFGNLEISFVSLFRVVTLEDWTDIMYIQMYGCDQYGYTLQQALCTQPQASPFGAALFFISFVLLGTMVVLNLFIGVILNGMDEAQKEADAADRAALQKQGKITLEGELTLVRERLAELGEHLAKVTRAVATAEEHASQATRGQARTHAAPIQEDLGGDAQALLVGSVFPPEHG